MSPNTSLATPYLFTYIENFLDTMKAHLEKNDELMMFSSNIDYTDLQNQQYSLSQLLQAVKEMFNHKGLMAISCHMSHPNFVAQMSQPAVYTDEHNKCHFGFKLYELMGLNSSHELRELYDFLSWLGQEQLRNPLVQMNLVTTRVGQSVSFELSGCAQSQALMQEKIQHSATVHRFVRSQLTAIEQTAPHLYDIWAATRLSEFLSSSEAEQVLGAALQHTSNPNRYKNRF